MMLPSVMRPVLERRAMREASSSVFRRKRSRNDIASLWLQGPGRNRATYATFRDVRPAHEHSVAGDPVVVCAQDLVFTRHSYFVLRECQSCRRCVVGCERSIANGDAA